MTPRQKAQKRSKTGTAPAKRKNVNKINIYFKRPADEQLVREAANLTDTSLSMFMRSALVEHAKKIISERESLAAERQLGKMEHTA